MDCITSPHLTYCVYAVQKIWDFAMRGNTDIRGVTYMYNS
jgi:hypothetical protein